MVECPNCNRNYNGVFKFCTYCGHVNPELMGEDEEYTEYVYKDIFDIMGQIMEQETPNEWHWINKAYYLKKLNRYDEEKECIDKAIELNHSNGTLWNLKGNNWFKLEKYEEAIECYNKAIETNPSNVESWNNKVLCLIALERYEEGIKCCNKIIELDPSNENAWDDKSFFFI